MSNLRRGDYAVAIFIKSPEGIPLVMDPKKPAPLYWKFVGGRSELGEDAIGAARREICEELGLQLKEKDLKLLFEENRENHKFVFFGAELASLNGMLKNGNEGEEIKTFSLEQIKQMPDFMPNHKMILQQLKII